MAKTAFISYASEDETVAGTICSYLERNAVSCWIAPRDVRPGSEYASEIIDGIKSSAVFVLVLSEHANTSAFVKREVLAPIAHSCVGVGLEICVDSELIEIFGNLGMKSSLSRYSDLESGLIFASGNSELAIHLIDQRQSLQIAGYGHGARAGMRSIPDERPLDQ